MAMGIGVQPIAKAGAELNTIFFWKFPIFERCLLQFILLGQDKALAHFSY
jgi:hypothetical protein